MLYLCSLITKCGLCENTFNITKTDILDKLSISDVRYFEYSLIYLSSISFDYKVHSSCIVAIYLPHISILKAILR